MIACKTFIILLKFFCPMAHGFREFLSRVRLHVSDIYVTKLIRFSKTKLKVAKWTTNLKDIRYYNKLIIQFFDVLHVIFIVFDAEDKIVIIHLIQLQHIKDTPSIQFSYNYTFIYIWQNYKCFKLSSYRVLLQHLHYYILLSIYFPHVWNAQAVFNTIVNKQV